MAPQWAPPYDTDTGDPLPMGMAGVETSDPAYGNVVRAPVPEHAGPRIPAPPTYHYGQEALQPGHMGHTNIQAMMGALAQILEGAGRPAGMPVMSEQRDPILSPQHHRVWSIAPPPNGGAAARRVM